MHKEPDWPQNVLLMKNSQFLSNFDQTLSKDPMDGLVNRTKFGYDYIKIVDFSLIAYFRPVRFFMHQSLHLEEQE